MTRLHLTRNRLLALASLIVLVAAVSVACGESDEHADSIPAPTTRNIQVTAFEIKGSTHASELEPPSVDPATLSKGYGFKDVGVYEADSDKWQVASYLWLPGEMTVFRGDTLNLNIFVLNGNRHDTWVQGPDGEVVVSHVELNRGREYELSFRVTKVGVYRLICDTHGPTMTADIMVLPRPAS